jgi:hypothetical protein
MDKFNERTTDIGAMGASELIAYERALTALRRWVESMERALEVARRTTA